MQGIKRSRLHGRAKENLLYLVFLLPAFALIGCVTLYPAVYNIFLSFTNMTLRNSAKTFVGLRNYIRLFGDTYVWQALRERLFICSSARRCVCSVAWAAPCCCAAVQR